MGLFDFPAPLFGAVDGVLGVFLPPFLRLVAWGVLAGWLTMVAYGRLSNQERIGELKREQKARQRQISEFDGDMDELLPLVFGTLRLGFRQLGLAIGPALLATVPVLFLVAWVAGAFGYRQPDAGAAVLVATEPSTTLLEWRPSAAAVPAEDGWSLEWPEPGARAALVSGDNTLITLPAEAAVPVIHRRLWWNLLFGNPLGYLPDDAPVERVDIALPAQQFIPAGPGWMRGWMFPFFGTFLLASIVFKFVLRID